MGRPLIGEQPLSGRIVLRVDSDTQKKIDTCKKELGTTASDVIRKGVNMIYDDLKK